MVEAEPSEPAPAVVGDVKETVRTFDVELESTTLRSMTGPGEDPLPLVYSSEPQVALPVRSTHLRNPDVHFPLLNGVNSVSSVVPR
jgi:hypothetical protein